MPLSKQLLFKKPILSTLVSIAFATLATNSFAAEKVYEMDVNHWQPSTHHYHFNVFEPWKKLVEEKTDGRVKVHLHTSSALGKSTSVYQDIRGGLYDVGMVIPSYFYDTKFFPLTIGILPFALEGPKSASSVLEEFSQKYAKDKLAEDLIIMPTTATDGYDFFSTKPIKSADDLKDLKVRIGGKSERPFVQALGGTAVSIPVEDIYEGLDKGMINASLYTPIGAVALKFNEPAPYITKIAATATPLVPVMSKDFYNELPEDLQKVFDEELNPELSELLNKSYTELLDKSHDELKDLVAKRGEFIELSDDAKDEFRQKAKPSWDAWIKDANKKGYDGQKMVDDYLKLLEKHGFEKPF